MPGRRRWPRRGAMVIALVGAVAHRMTAASAVLLASLLVPVPPLDGAHVTARWLGVGSAVGLGAVTVALAMGWV